MIVNLRRTKDVVTDLTLCDVDASELCVVTFGTDILDNMIINFQLPDADYPLFYVKASNRGNVNAYPCEVVTAVPTSVYCSGARTPLGEYIDMKVYATKGDVLIARGKFSVSALVRATSIDFGGTPTTPGASTPTPGIATPNPSTNTPTPTTESTATPGTAYPNP